MTSASKFIILYPREYNLRGGDSKGSVKGITQDGEMVNIKLRVTGNLKDEDAAPSISAFSKGINEGNQSCLATPDNGPDSPHGILLFLNCEVERARDPDPVYSNYYISRWAYILRTGHPSPSNNLEAPLPFLGVGRIAIDKNTKEIRDSRAAIATLEKNKHSEWEQAVARQQAVIDDYKRFRYYLYGYLCEQEAVFESDNFDQMVAWMDTKLGNPEHNANNGLLIRVQTDDGLIQEMVCELFPIHLKTLMRYQNASELMAHYRKANPEVDGLREVKYRVMPMVRFAGKKKLTDQLHNRDDFERFEQTYYLGDQPLVFPMAVRIDRLDNSERLINKVHLIGPSLGDPARLDAKGTCSLIFDFEDKLVSAALSGGQAGIKLVVEGISMASMLPFASWYSQAPLPVALIPARDAWHLQAAGTDADGFVVQPVIQTPEADTMASESAHKYIDTPCAEKHPEDALQACREAQIEVDTGTPSVSSLDDLLDEPIAEDKLQGVSEADDLLALMDGVSGELIEESEESSLFGTQAIDFNHLGNGNPLLETIRQAVSHTELDASPESGYITKAEACEIQTQFTDLTDTGVEQAVERDIPDPDIAFHDQTLEDDLRVLVDGDGDEGFDDMPSHEGSLEVPEGDFDSADRQGQHAEDDLDEDDLFDEPALNQPAAPDSVTDEDEDANEQPEVPAALRNLDVIDLDSVPKPKGGLGAFMRQRRLRT